MKIFVIKLPRDKNPKEVWALVKYIIIWIFFQRGDKSLIPNLEIIIPSFVIGISHDYNWSSLKWNKVKYILSCFWKGVVLISTASFEKNYYVINWINHADPTLSWLRSKSQISKVFSLIYGLLSICSWSQRCLKEFLKSWPVPAFAFSSIP